MVIATMCFRCSFKFLSILLLVFGIVEGNETLVAVEPWQECDLFLAPCSTGWGAFAARDFAEGENVIITPLVLRTLDDTSDSITKSSVLDDYVYGYQKSEQHKYSSVVLYGYAMFLNHHPNPNLEYYMIGSGAPHTMGFIAKRAIRAGEQLYATYGHHDGGVRWFALRKMEMMAPPESIIPPERLPYFRQEFCSNIYASFGRPLWETALRKQGRNTYYGIDSTRLAPFDGGLGNARAKRFIPKGTRVEIGPGLILSSQLISGSVFGSLVYSWTHLTEEQKAELRILRTSGQLKLQHQGYDTSWLRVDNFESFEDLSILPSGGQLGLVRRVGDSASSNCRLNILSEYGQEDSVTVILELIATEDIDSGELLLLNLPPMGTKEELELLHVELTEFGQRYYEEPFNAITSIRLEKEEL